MSVHENLQRDGSNGAGAMKSRGAAALFFCSIVLVAAGFACSAALGSQTREQCEKCCQSKETDEYYLEQCKLKCFRAPDHCQGRGAEERTVRPTPKPAPAPERKPAAKPQPAPSALKYPNPLRIVPGKEWEAASLILTLNGIPPQHRNHQEAMKSMIAVLLDFVKRHPQGGQLPTSALEAIVKKFR